MACRRHDGGGGHGTEDVVYPPSRLNRTTSPWVGGFLSKRLDVDPGKPVSFAGGPCGEVLRRFDPFAHADDPRMRWSGFVEVRICPIATTSISAMGPRPVARKMRITRSNASPSMIMKSSSSAERRPHGVMLIDIKVPQASTIDLEC